MSDKYDKRVIKMPWEQRLERRFSSAQYDFKNPIDIKMICIACGFSIENKAGLTPEQAIFFRDHVCLKANGTEFSLPERVEICSMAADLKVETEAQLKDFRRKYRFGGW